MKKVNEYERRLEYWDVAALPPNEELIGRPERKLIDSIKDYGVIEPLILVTYRRVPFLVAGNRRLMAVRTAKRELDRDNLKSAHLDTVPVQVYVGVNPEDRDAMAWISNEMRSDNPVHQMQIYRRLVADGRIDEATEQWRANKGTFKKYGKLLDIAEEFWFDAFADNTIAKSTLFGLAGLSKPLQAKARDIYQEAGKLTGTHIKDLKRVNTNAVLSNFDFPTVRESRKKETYYLLMDPKSLEFHTDENGNVYLVTGHVDAINRQADERLEETHRIFQMTEL